MGIWNLIENAIEGAADFVRNTGIIDKIVEIGEGIADWFKDVFNIGDAPSYDKDNATIDETKKVNEILQTYIEKCLNISEKYDNISKEEINKYFSQIKNSLIDINKISENNTENSDKVIEDYIFFRNFRILIFIKFIFHHKNFLKHRQKLLLQFYRA